MSRHVCSVQALASGERSINQAQSTKADRPSFESSSLERWRWSVIETRRWWLHSPWWCDRRGRKIAHDWMRL